LIVDDEADVRSTLADALGVGRSVVTASDGYQALGKFAELKPDVVLTDLKLPGMDGIALLQKLRELDADCPVVLITGSRRVDSAVQAIRQGAADYIAKPINLEELNMVIDRAIERGALRREARDLRLRLAGQQRIESIVGSSAAIESVRKTILQVAPSRACVLISGESGTGKERVATAIHEHSPRAKQAFVKLHCAALAESLLESELFGHERGAFTGAIARREGRFQQADGGTLFLDEVGEISPSVQVKLLRFLQEHEFERVGGNKTIRVDVRVVAATNRDLMAEVRHGRFREDLFYRLNVVQIVTPPLRGRRADIPELADRFLRQAARMNGRPVRGFTDEALEALVRYPWPGNVRELENAVERAVVMAVGDHIDVDDLPPMLAPPGADEMPTVPGASLAELERFAILRTLEHTGGCKAQAARLLGVTQRTIQNKLHTYADDDGAAGKRLAPIVVDDEGSGPNRMH
jgi:DNA-binding NtrC family response regulator